MKLANKKFTSIKNDHALTFDTNADIVEVDDDQQIKTQGFSFVPLKDIENLMQGSAVDCIGVIVESGSVTNMQLKNG